MSLVSTVQQVSLGIATLIGGALVGEDAGGFFQTFWLAGLFTVIANFIVIALMPSFSKIEREVAQYLPEVSRSIL